MKFSSSLVEAIHRFDASENAHFKACMGRKKFVRLPKGYVPFSGLYTIWSFPVSANKGWRIDKIPEIEEVVEDRLKAKVDRDFGRADNLKNELYKMGVATISDGRL